MPHWGPSHCFYRRAARVCREVAPRRSRNLQRPPKLRLSPPQLPQRRVQIAVGHHAPSSIIGGSPLPLPRLIQDVRGNRSRQHKFGGLRHRSSSANAIVAPLAKRRLPRFMRPPAHSQRVPWLRVLSASRVAYLQANPPAAGIGHGCGDFRMMWSDAVRRPSFNRALANGRESTSPMLKYSWRPGPPLARSLFSVAEGDV
jgi:hypothetical protein